MNKKQLITAGVLVGAIALTGVYGVHTAKAAETTDTTFPPMIQKMVEKFNLNKDEVKVLMKEDREDHQTEMKKNFSTKLDELVSSGKITAEQRDKIVAKHDELDAKRNDLRDQNLSREEMHTKMQEIHTEMTDFLNSIGVDESLLPMGKGHRVMKGEGRGMHRGF